LSEDVDGDGRVTKLQGKSVLRQWARWAETAVDRMLR